jgi:hypothetical protein
MQDIINDINTWSVLKWVIIVLVAGFIGQFGKSMAQAIMVKVRLARAKKEKIKDPGPPRTTPPDTEAPDPVKNNFYEKAVAGTGASDKKTLKTIAKQEKKAAKLVKKEN